MTGETDAWLVECVRMRDGAAAAELHRRYRDAVRWVLIDPARDPGQIDELVEECFLRAFGRLHALHDPRNFRPLLLQIARSTALDHRRTRSRQRRASIAGQDSGTEAEPEGRRLTDELAALAGAVGSGRIRVSRRDAAAISLVVHLGFGVSEVAAALGVRRGTAEVVLSRVHGQLRDGLRHATSAGD